MAQTQLTPAQEQVIAAISGGATLQAAAASASVHRNTIACWRRSSMAFREGLNHAQYDKALFIREQAEAHLADAFAALHAILTDPKASASVRLNAAKYIIDKASTPPLPDPEPVYRIQLATQSGLQPETQPETVHSPAQTIVHKNAQSPTPAPANPLPPNASHQPSFDSPRRL